VFSCRMKARSEGPESAWILDSRPDHVIFFICSIFVLVVEAVMYAVIKTGGKQYKVSPGEMVRVERLPGEVGSELDISDVLMVVDGSHVRIGRPVVENGSVRATVVEHGRGKKVLIMKKKRRKGYSLKKGHRQSHTTLEIKEIRL